MSTSTLSPIDQAAAQEFEYYGSTITTNNALTWVVLALVILIGVLSWQVVRLSREAIVHKPLIVTVDEAGKATAVDLRFQADPQDHVIKYFLADFIQSYYGRNRRTIKDSYARSLYYLSNKEYSRESEQELKSHWIAKFINSGDDEVSIHAEYPVLDTTGKPNYRAQVEYQKIYTNSTGQETKRESFTDIIYFTIDPNLPNRDLATLLTNPLGFSIYSIVSNQTYR